MSFKEQIVSILVNIMFMLVILCDAIVGVPSWVLLCAVAVGVVYSAYIVLRLIRVRRSAKK